MIDEKYAAVINVSLDSVAPIKNTGIRVIECRDFYAKLLMPLAGNTNHVGTMYAGPLFTLGEAAGGVAFLVSLDYNKYFPLVKRCEIRFRKPAVSDITVEVRMDSEWASRLTAEVEGKDKADFEMDIEMKGSGGNVVATLNGTYQVRKIPPGMKLPWT